MRLAALLIVLLASPLHADTLGKLATTLRSMSGTAPLRATLELHVVIDEEGKQPIDGRAAVSITATGDGLSVSYPAAELRRAEAEQRDTDPEKPEPATRALGSIDAVAIASAIHYAPGLLARLEGARVLKESATTYRGEPAQLLELELAVRMSKDDAKHVKQAKRSAKLWIAADGTPLAEEIADHFKARFLVISFEMRRNESRQFTRLGDRLVVTRSEEKSDGSGFGESTKRRTVTVLRVNGST